MRAARTSTKTIAPATSATASAPAMRSALTLLRRLAAAREVLQLLELVLEGGIRLGQVAVAADQDLAGRLAGNALLELRQERAVALQERLIGLTRERGG